MKHLTRSSFAALSLLVLNAASAAEIDLDAARQQFRAAQDICTADGGRLWGVSLCGPIMLVDPQTRRIVTNQADKQGALQEKEGVYVGSLPKELSIANTATDWSGVLWTQVVWPLPADRSRRDILLAHESYHRIQGQVAVPRMNEAVNAHLDMPEGRYLLQLEWRALAAALRCSTPTACELGLADALLFRAARYRQFPKADAQERTLELNEGLAEYTGIAAARKTRAEQVESALQNLGEHVADPSFTRSFAYATGPALGLLLDQYAPNWRQTLSGGPPLHEPLQRAVNVPAPGDFQAAVAAAAARYDGATLRSAELEREQRRQRVLAANRAKFVEGAVLVIPTYQMSIQFNPSNVQPLDELGTVYETLRVSDLWGVLEVSGGALLGPNWRAVTVVAPKPNAIQGGTLKGEGWKLTLKPDWKVVAAERKGDFTVARAKP